MFFLFFCVLMTRLVLQLTTADQKNPSGFQLKQLAGKLALSTYYIYVYIPWVMYL